MRYIVTDNGKKANETGFPSLKGKGWKFAWFNSLERARKYADKWLGDTHRGIGMQLEPNKPVDYSGYGDMIEIKELKK